MQFDTINYLEEMSRVRPIPTGWTVNSIEQFVLLNGRRFNRVALPKGVRFGGVGICFQNATRLARRRGLIYVEGYARWSATMIPFLHAWCADDDGNAYDPTWLDGCDYFGVPIDLDYAIRRRKVSPWQSILDSPPDFPIINGRDQSWRPTGHDRALSAVAGAGILDDAIQTCLPDATVGNISLNTSYSGSFTDRDHWLDARIATATPRCPRIDFVAETAQRAGMGIIPILGVPSSDLDVADYMP